MSKNLFRRQRVLAQLCDYAETVDGLDGQTDEFLRLSQKARTDVPMNKIELALLTQMVQQTVQLQVYTLEQAAAWLGVATDGIRRAAYSGLIATVKPGHDLLMTHAEVLRLHTTGSGRQRGYFA